MVKTEQVSLTNSKPSPDWGQTKIKKSNTAVVTPFLPMASSQAEKIEQERKEKQKQIKIERLQKIQENNECFKKMGIAFQYKIDNDGNYASLIFDQIVTPFQDIDPLKISINSLTNTIRIHRGPKIKDLCELIEDATLSFKSGLPVKTEFKWSNGEEIIDYSKIITLMEESVDENGKSVKTPHKYPYPIKRIRTFNGKKEITDFYVKKDFSYDDNKKCNIHRLTVIEPDGSKSYRLWFDSPNNKSLTLDRWLNYRAAFYEKNTADKEFPEGNLLKKRYKETAEDGTTTLTDEGKRLLNYCNALCK